MAVLVILFFFAGPARAPSSAPCLAHSINGRTFAVMYQRGFSLNMMTRSWAWSLAIGLLIDDVCGAGEHHPQA
ncbi:MAG: efflux RND transporter permease subunit [Deltaproteobacteria bacterium]|nr:efflux RND transporter permease subunit [Deltaproteobacteria bacterium]